MNFFEMLVLSRKMAFEDGRITLYNQEVLIFPHTPMKEYIIKIDEDNVLKRTMYVITKESMIEYKQDIIKIYKNADSINVMCSTINLLGLGTIKYDTPANGLLGTITLDNSPVAKDVSGKVKAPVDHILRGIIAGMISIILDKDVDAIEIECFANTNTPCKLFIETPENIKAKYLDIYNRQIK